MLNTICGYSVELCKSPRLKHVPPHLQLRLSDIEIMQIEEELDRLIKEDKKRFIKRTKMNTSNIVTCPKKERKIWVILNLKQFNEEVMEHIHSL